MVGLYVFLQVSGHLDSLCWKQLACLLHLPASPLVSSSLILELCHYLQARHLLPLYSLSLHVASSAFVGESFDCYPCSRIYSLFLWGYPLVSLFLQFFFSLTQEASPESKIFFEGP